MNLLSRISQWMGLDVLQFSTENTDLIVFGPKNVKLGVNGRLDPLTLKKNTDQARNLSVAMDSGLN